MKRQFAQNISIQNEYISRNTIVFISYTSDRFGDFLLADKHLREQRVNILLHNDNKPKNVLH